MAQVLVGVCAHSVERDLRRMVNALGLAAPVNMRLSRWGAGGARGVPPGRACAYAGRAMRPILLLLALGACAAVPPLGPGLAPAGPLLAAADALPAAPGFAPGLRAAAQGLAARATPPPPPQDAAGEEARLAALEARAEALRAEGLTDADRERLLQGPSLP